MTGVVEVALTVVDPAALTGPLDLVVSAPAGTPVEDVTGPLLAAAGLPGGTRLLLGGGEPLPAGATLGAPPLLRGAVLVPDAQGAGRGSGWPRPRALLALHVTGGPDAGHVLPLAPGRHLVGRAGRSDLRLEDPEVSRDHLEVEVTGDGVRVRDGGSANGTAVDGQPLAPGWHRLAEGARVHLGSTTLVLRRPGGPRAPASPAGDGHVDVHRGPRLVHPPAPVVLHLPAAPERPGRARLSVLALVLPVAVAVPVALLWSPLALLFALTGPVLALGNAAGDRRSSRRAWAQRTADHERRTDRLRDRAAAAVEHELEALEVLHPDPATLLATATRRGVQLWERRRTDPDALVLRLGTGAVPSGVTLVSAPPTGDDDEEPTREHREVPAHVAAPVVVPLAGVGVLGVSGPLPHRRALACSLVAQATVLHSPLDLQVVVLCARRTAAWAWVGWLPHSTPGSAPGSGGAEVVCGPEAVVPRVAELVALLRERSATAPAGTHPWVVVVLDGAQQLRALPGVALLLAEGPRAGVLVVCVDEDVQRLPLECSATAELDAGPPVRLRWRSGGGDALQVVPDLVGPRWCDRLARALAPLRDATPGTGSRVVPSQVRLLDLLAETGTEAADPGAVRASWERRASSTRVVLGATATDRWEVDLRRDGPHVLVAGTTGSGKSELLTSLVVALAVGNRPDRLALVLVDHKGGAAFAAVAGLPHTVGLVTDLDPHLTRRALASLEAEVRRRERVLRRWGCRDAEDLEAACAAGRAGELLPRLVLVVDEFRVFAEEQPEVLSGLVRVAAVGRSLGIHLVLATQRPAGVVSADIRANTNLRVALRVRDDVDSLDVVDAPDAARAGAGGAGRAWARTGGGPLVEVQVAGVSGGAPSTPAAGVRVVRLDAGGADAGAAAPPGRSGTGTPDAEPDDLARVVAAVTSAATGLPRVPSPWAPPLPEVLVLPPGAGGPRSTGAEERSCGTVPPEGLAYGLVDDPDQQSQSLLTWSLSGPLLVVGGPRTGRTAALRALAAGLAGCSPARVHLHAVQGRGGGLEELADLPQAGAVVDAGDAERVLRLLRVLTRLLEQRQGGAALPDPRVVLLVDGADAWTAPGASAGADHDEAAPLLQRLLAEGPAAGVLVVLAGGRALLTGRLGSSVPERLVLALPDPTDALLAGVPARDLPPRMPPGRAVRVGPGGVHEAQVALLDEDPGPRAQRTALAVLAARAADRWRDVPVARRPVRVPAVPPHLSAAELDRRAASGGPPGAGAVTAAGAVLLGVGGSEGLPLALDLRATPAALVAGPAGSGRTSTLLALAQRLHTAGRRVALVSPHRSELTVWAAGQDLPVVDGRGVEGRQVDALAAALAPRGATGTVVVVDDLELLTAPGVEDALLAHLDGLGAAAGERRPGGLLLAGTTADLLGRFRGLVPAVRRARTGVLLHPFGPADGELLGVRLPRPAPGPVGRATLVRAGVAELVQLAAPRP